MDIIDAALARLGLVRRSRYDHLMETYREVFGWWARAAMRD